jgi:hypothetical protein
MLKVLKIDPGKIVFSANVRTRSEVEEMLQEQQEQK